MHNISAAKRREHFMSAAMELFAREQIDSEVPLSFAATTASSAAPIRVVTPQGAIRAAF